MRTYQIDIKITDTSERGRIFDYKDPNSFGKIHTYKVYADANNYYEAVAMATKSMIDVYQNSHEAPFGCIYAYKDGEIVFDK